MMIRISMMTALATLVVGCGTLDMNSLTKAVANKTAVAVTAITATDAVNGNAGGKNENAKIEYLKRTENANTKSIIQTNKVEQAPAVDESVKTVEKSQNAAKEAKGVTVEIKPPNIAEIADDKAFFEAFKKSDKTNDVEVLKRGREMKDEKLLVEFVRMYPSQAKRIALSKQGLDAVKSSELAELLIDNIEDPNLSSYYEGWNQVLGMGYILFDLVEVLNDSARAKYLDRAKSNREKAAKDGVVIFEKFYIGMPVIDYVMISFADKQPWIKREDAVIGWLQRRSDMKTDISGKDWRTAWKIDDISFEAMHRYKYFKIKGTTFGLVEFARKYLDKSAELKDLTFDRGWWSFKAEEHGLEVSIKEDSGILNIATID